MRPRSSIPPLNDKPALNAFVSYLKDYFRIVSLKSLFFTMLFAGILVSLNYTIGIEKRIRDIHPLSLSLLGFFLFYGFVFFGAWAIQYCFERPADLTGNYPSTGTLALTGRPRGQYPGNSGIVSGSAFPLLLLLAPLYFAFKMIHWNLSFLVPAGWHFPWNIYTLNLLQLPAKLVLLLLMLMACRRIVFPTPQQIGPVGNAHMSAATPQRIGGWAAWGLTAKGFSSLPYLLLLVFLAPLVAMASTRHDFLHAYPKFRSIAFIGGYASPVWPWRLLYELSYGLDFVSIELFFRGFLVIGLARWAGPKVILPMTAFYCTVHFGKPLGECISSFCGGLILGVIAWRTRSILGGLMVHLGLAWMMEIGGWAGGMYS